MSHLVKVDDFECAKIIFHSSTAVVQLAVNQLVVGSIPASGARTRDPVHVINGGRAVTIESAGCSVH